MFGPWKEKLKLNQCVLLLLVFIWSCERAEIDLLVSDVGEAAAHMEWRVFCEFLCCHLPSDIYSNSQCYHNSYPAEFGQRSVLFVFDFHLISFFEENDFGAFFPSRSHIYCQDFVLDTGCKSICIHNLLTKENKRIFLSLSPSFLAQLSSYPARYLNLFGAPQVEIFQG